MSKTYKVGEIALEVDEQGDVRYWLYNYGKHAGQGEVGFTRGNIGCPSLDSLNMVIKTWLERDLKELIKLIEEREKK